MSQDARIFLVTAVITLIYVVIIPLLARRKRVELPKPEEAEAPTLTPIEGGGRPAVTTHRRKAA